MVKIELDIEGISWYIETTLETDTVPAVGDIIIMDKDCISERDSAELWKTPSIRFSNGRTKKMMRL